MMNRLTTKLAAVALVLASSQSAFAFGKKKACAPACDAPACGSASSDCGVAYHEVEKTVMAPEWVTETRKVMTTVCQPVTRERKVTVQKQVWETRDEQRKVVELVPEQKVEQYKYTVSVPVWKDVAREYTVMVPTQEKRQGTRQVCRMVSSKEKRTVSEDKGHWEEQVIESAAPCNNAGPACGAPACEPCAPACEPACAPKKCFLTGLFKKKNKCAPACDVAPACDAAPACDSCGSHVVAAPATRKVWVANMVQREIEVDVVRPQYTTENYEYTVTVCRPEKRTSTVKVCTYEQQERTGERRYTVCSRRERVENVKVNVCRWQPEERTEKYTVMEAQQVEKEVQVRVCRMVEKKIMVKVAVPVHHVAAPCGDAGNCGHAAGCADSNCGGCH